MGTFFESIDSRLDEIKGEYKDKRVLLVTHGGINIPLSCYFNGIPNQENLLNLVLSNCEVVSYTFEKER
ncbi:MAG: histidine phosphatase family protein [Clostridia bacterium]